MQRITVFQEKNSGQSKIAGIRRFGGDRFSLEVVTIDEPLPPVIDDAGQYLPETLDTDLVLDFLKHPDLSSDLAILCRRLGIPVIASGKKITAGEALTPPT
jgi:hypothetical protein